MTYWVRVELSGCLKPLGAKMVVMMISTTNPIVRMIQRRGAK